MSSHLVSRVTRSLSFSDRPRLTRSLSKLIVRKDGTSKADIDELLQILDDHSEPPDNTADARLLDVLLVLAVLAARVSRPLAYGIALAGRDRYPFSAATAQFVGLFMTCMFFGILSLRTPECFMQRTSADYKIMGASFFVGLIAGLGDVADMFSAQFIGFGLATVIQAASRVVMTALMSKYALGRDISEIQAWNVLQVALSITAFTLLTNQLNTSLTVYSGTVGVSVALAAAFFLSCQGTAKEFFAKGEGHNVNYSMSMCLLFAGCSSSSFIVAAVELHGNMMMFFHGWEMKSIAVPVALSVMSASSSIFTKWFGALTTMLLNIASLVCVYFSSVFFFGQACSVLAITLVSIVLLSVLMTMRSGMLAKQQQTTQQRLEKRIASGHVVAQRLSEPLLDRPDSPASV